jgi:hypothetical protein
VSHSGDVMCRALAYASLYLGRSMMLYVLRPVSTRRATAAHQGHSQQPLGFRVCILGF